MAMSLLKLLGKCGEKQEHDLLLLDVAMVQWLGMIRKWQSQNVAWTTQEKISAAIRWYLLGQNVGQTPMYEGICAFCGTLLYGTLNATEFGNKWSGYPVGVNGNRKNRNGQNLTNAMLRDKPKAEADRLRLPKKTKWVQIPGTLVLSS